MAAVWVLPLGVQGGRIQGRHDEGHREPHVESEKETLAVAVVELPVLMVVLKDDVVELPVLMVVLKDDVVEVPEDDVACVLKNVHHASCCR